MRFCIMWYVSKYMYNLEIKAYTKFGIAITITDMTFVPFLRESSKYIWLQSNNSTDSSIIIWGG